MTPDQWVTLLTAVVSIIGAITGLVVAIKANGKVNNLTNTNNNSKPPQ